MSRAVGIASLLYAGSILLSRLIGLVREAVIGHVLGAGGEADVYLAAFVVPDFLNYLLAAGILSIVFIPVFQRYLADDDEDGAWDAFSAIATFLAAAVGIGTGALWIGAPWLAPVVVPGLAPDQHALLVEVVRILLPAQIFHVVGGVVSATLQARDKHALPALAPLVYTACIVAGGLALGPSIGAKGFAWGVLAGSILGSFGLPLIGALRHGMRWRPTLSLGHPELRRYLGYAFPVMLGVSIVAADEWLTKYFGSSMAEGTIARLHYARILVKVPMGVFGMAGALAAFPTLSRLAARGERDAMYATLMAALRATLVLALLATAALVVAGTEIATVIWGRFSPETLDAIGLYTAVMSVGLWAWALQLLGARAFYAEGRFWLPTLLGTGVTAGAVGIYAVGAGQGPIGLAAASAISVSLYAIVLLVTARRRLAPSNPGPGLLDAAMRSLPGVAAGVAAGLGLEAMLPPLPALARGALSGGVALTVAAIGVGLAGVPEVKMLAGRVRAKLGR